MTRYNVRVIDMVVHRWGDDGQGEYVCDKGGFDIGSYPTLEHAKKAIEEYFGYELHSSNYQDEHIYADLIEDEHGYADEDGSFIVYYVLCVEKVEIIDFSAMPH